MTAALRSSMSQADFFAWAERQVGRYEFDGSQPVAMSGGTMNHGLIADNIRAELKQRLRGGPCRPVGSDGAGVETTGGRMRYPEATITCSPFDGTDRKVPDPVAVFEVLSESTRHIDQVFKLREYQAVPTIRRYILVEQTGIALTHHARQGVGPWVTEVLGEGDVLSLPDLGISIPLSAIYEGVTLLGAELGEGG